MGTLYIDTGGSATNSGSTDTNAATLSGTGDAVVAGSVVTLTAGTDLTAVVTAAGATQSTIYIAQATNTNQKVFWITAKADSGGATPNVTVSVAPTGVTASNWAIGGQQVWTQANIKGALRPLDEVIVNNSPASAAAIWFSPTVAGSASGRIIVRGKVGVRPVVTVTNTAVLLDIASLNPCFHRFENFEWVQQGASGNVVGSSAGAQGLSIYRNIKISDGGGDGFNFPSGGQADLIMLCDIGGVGGDCIDQSTTGRTIVGNYLHDAAGNGITTAAPPNCRNNIIDSCAGRGIQDTTSSTFGAAASFATAVEGLTVYGCGNSGLEVTDADEGYYLFSSIFAENGNAAGEYNVEWLAESIERSGIHECNIFFHSGGGGGANLSGLTVNATEFTTDPLFSNPTGGDFALGSTSPGKATGFPLAYLGANTNYRDIGAVQRQEAAGTTQSSSASVS